MSCRSLILCSVVLLVACQATPDVPQPPATPEPEPAATIPCTEAIQVTSPQPNHTVASPLTVAGQARGTWYFEASFTVRLYDVNMNELAVAPAQAQGEWMTEDFVPFEVTLPAHSTDGPLGYLFLEKRNASDEMALSCSVVIPVQF